MLCDDANMQNNHPHKYDYFKLQGKDEGVFYDSLSW